MFKLQYHPHYDPVSLTGAAITAGAALAGQGAQMLMTGKMNRKTRAWNEKMMHRQRDWALSDYHMQNAYNSPSAQMERLREAGLNPNLVYGNGASTQAAANVNKTDKPGWNPETPNVDFGRAGSNAVQTYYDIKMRDAQLNLMRQDALNKEEQNLLLQAQRRNLDSRSTYQDWKNDFEKGLEQTSADIRTENLRRLRISSDYLIDENARRTLLTSQSLKEGIERILNHQLGRQLTGAQIRNLNQQIKNMGLDQRMKEIENAMAEKGIFKHDPLYMRVGATILENIKKTWPGFQPESGPSLNLDPKQGPVGAPKSIFKKNKFGRNF